MRAPIFQISFHPRMYVIRVINRFLCGFIICSLNNECLVQISQNTFEQRLWNYRVFHVAIIFFSRDFGETVFSFLEFDFQKNIL